MGSRTYMIFMSVNLTDISLSIVDWTKDDRNVWKLFEDARDRKTKDVLYNISGKCGYHLQDILKVKDRCNLSSLDFLSLDVLEDERGATLKSSELRPAIRSLAIIIDELLSAVDTLDCLYNGSTINKDKMRIAFEKSEVYHDVDLDRYDEEGLFIVLKSLLSVMTDALVNNKVFVYINFTA